MDRCIGLFKVPLNPKSTAHYRLAASLCISPSTKALRVPAANVIFFNGDRVEGTGNPVIERLSNIQNIAEILVSKFGASINAWVIEASTFNGPFAVYKEFIPSLNGWGEPQYYKPDGFPASTTVVELLTNFLEKRAKNVTQEEHDQTATTSPTCPPRTIMLGFSKGGAVLNQLVTELGFSDAKCTGDPSHPKDEHFRRVPGNSIIPCSRESLLDSISEIHYIDVGLNSTGAYLTDDSVIERIAERLIEIERSVLFVLHGTPRQWSDRRRGWIREEKDSFRHSLESRGQKSGGKLQVCERFYFANKSPDLQMHFEIIEELVVS